MIEMKYPHVDFVNVTDDMRRPGDFAPPSSETWQCWFNKVYIGFIGYDQDMEQYVFYPIVDTQLVLTFSVLHDIMLKIYDLMKSRRLN